MKSQDELGKQLETFDLLVVVSGEKLTDTEMSILLDACLVHRVPTALFLSDDTPSLRAVREIAAQKFYVGIPKEKRAEFPDQGYGDERNQPISFYRGRTGGDHQSDRKRVRSGMPGHTFLTRIAPPLTSCDSKW